MQELGGADNGEMLSRAEAPENPLVSNVSHQTEFSIAQDAIDVLQDIETLEKWLDKE